MMTVDCASILWPIVLLVLLHVHWHLTAIIKAEGPLVSLSWMENSDG